MQPPFVGFGFDVSSEGVGVWFGLEGMQPPFVGFGFDVSSEGVGVNEVFGAMNTVKLSKTSFVIVNCLRQKFLHFARTEVSINLIKVLCPPFKPPSLLQMCVSIVIFFPLINWTTHD